MITVIRVMSRTFGLLPALTAASAVLVAGCLRRPPEAARPLPWPPEERCWWAPFRSGLPPDSVAVRFARAYTALGLTEATWSRRADTAWAQAGPSVLADSVHAGVYAARVVAFRRGDSTLFRTFVATPPAAANPARDNIVFCVETMRAARTAATAPRPAPHDRVEEPEHEAPVWRRRP